MKVKLTKDIEVYHSKTFKAGEIVTIGVDDDGNVTIGNFVKPFLDSIDYEPVWEEKELYGDIV